MGMVFPSKPTTSRLLSGGVQVDCYGMRNDADSGRRFNYAINGFQSGAWFVRFLKRQMATRYRDLNRLYVPNCTAFNAKVWDEDEFDENPWPTGYLQDNAVGWPQEIWGGKVVAGVRTEPGSAVWLSLGDCPAIILYLVEEGVVTAMVVVHGGRWELFNLKNRRRRSVVPEALRFLTRGRVELLPCVHAGIFCSIAGRHFPHPTDDHRYPLNKELIDEIVACHLPNQPEVLSGEDPNKGLISLPHVIMSQMEAHGVNIDQIFWDQVDTYADKDKEGRFLWPSNKRGDSARLGVMAYIK